MPGRDVSAAGVRFVVVDDKDSFWDRVEAGTWEPETLSALAALIGPGTLLVDIGAWIGPITLTAAALGADVLAFEPDPRAHELLGANIVANPAFASRIGAHRRAASPVEGRIRLASPRKPGDSMGSVLAAGRGHSEWDAEATTPQQIAALAGEARRIVVKIDIEGAEYALLPVLGPLLGSGTAAALIAFHPRLMRDAGYSGAAIEAATRTAVAAMAGFTMRCLDNADGEGVSTSVNSTMLFERRANGEG